MKRAIVVGMLVVASTGPPLSGESARAGGIDLSGLIAGETRWFPESPAISSQLEGLQSSLVLQPELRYETRGGGHQFTLIPFARLDGRDGERTHFDLREAHWRTLAGDVEILAGINTVFWGVTESRHLVDVINQVDGVEDVDGEDKLGQPMLRLTWQRDWGRLEGFALVGFRETTLPGASGRLGLPGPAGVEPLFPDGRAAVDVAVRYSHYFGDYDVGLHWFHGTNREYSSRTVPTGDPAAPLRVRPVYRRIDQLGMDLQRTEGAWLWKLEALARAGDGETFAAAVAGFEYTLYQVRGTGADLGLLGEFLYDGRGGAAAPTVFDRDVFLGARLALNDVSGTAALGGVVIDARDGSVAARLEIERRLSNRIKLEVEGRFFLEVAEGNALALYRQDTFLNLRIAHGL